MRGRRLRWGLAALAVLFAVGMAVLLPRPERAMIVRYGRLQKGMGRAAVYSTLGGPPTSQEAGPHPPVNCFWEGYNYRVQVIFDDDECLSWAGLESADSRPVTDTALDWLFRRWRRWFP